MTSDPGGVERIPLKVVPYYVDIQPEIAKASEVPIPDETDWFAVRRRPWVGVVALVLAAATAALQIVAIVAASGGDYAQATWLGFAAIAVSIAAVGLGIVAIATDRGRSTGVVAVALGFVANPLVLLTILRTLGNT